ncbi:MAG: PhzF family phenazine biosynthesis protein, partial [Bdellovibrionales bacterium]|nr:PhzF family phenazine biosynthesis protein [Bdellovibrionales bacterium]
GVLIASHELSEDLMQNIALELNLSETAFVSLSKNPFEIRWFTPNSEVDLCGHATLAAAHILWTENFIQSSTVEFTSKSGPLFVKRRETDYQMSFPAQPGESTPALQSLVNSILGVDASFIASNGSDCMAVVEDEDFVKRYVPNLALIAKLPERGFLLTTRAIETPVDYIYRGFFPKLAIPEDPVTGSANTILAPYWATRLGKSLLRAYQASPRGGQLGLELENDRVLISGVAVTSLSGTLHL